jgi:hypothetical protein
LAIVPLVMRGPTTVLTHRGLSPHQFTPMSGAHKSAPGKGGITSLFHALRPCPALPERYRCREMRAILLLLLLSVLVSCSSTPSTKATLGARVRAVNETLKAYHSDLHDYPEQLSALRPRYLSADIPLHEEQYPESLRPLWSQYEQLELPSAPVYQRIAKDCFLSYRRIDRDNYSLQLIANGRFVGPECKSATSGKAGGR